MDTVNLFARPLPKSVGATQAARRSSAQQHLVLKEMNLTEEGIIKYGRLVTEFRVTQGLVDNRAAQAICERLAAKYERLVDLTQASDSPLTWLDLHDFELALRAMTPIEELEQMLCSLRSQYRKSASPEAFEQYVQSRAFEKLSGSTATDHRAEICILVGAIQRVQTFAVTRERLRGHLSINVLLMAIAACCFAGALYGCLVGADPSVMRLLHIDPDRALPKLAPTLTLVILMGTLGGFVSVQQRLQSAYNDADPIGNILELKFGSGSLYFAPAGGAIFATILFYMFAADLITGDLFPLIGVIGHGLPVKDTQDTPMNFDSLRYTGPATICDMAKLLVWSFIAGFAERFVPDTLDRLVGQSRQRSARQSIQNQVQLASAAFSPQAVTPENPHGK